MPWLLILSLNVTPAPPAATMPGFVSSGVLRMLCDPSPDGPNRDGQLCLGYVAGVADELLAREARRRVTRRKLCLPPGATVDDLRDAVIAYRNATGAADDVAAASLVRVALEASFPCGTLGAPR